MNNTDTEFFKEKFYEIFNKIKGDKKVFLTVVCSAVLMFVLCVSELNNKEDVNSEVTEVKTYNYFVETKEVEEFLENISGAGNVRIMITYDSSEEYIYAKDTNENSKDKKESDKEINYKSEHIIIKEDGNEKGLMIKEIYPEIRGIAVLCDGGDNPLIKERIVSLLSALFGINTNRISVVAKSN